MPFISVRFEKGRPRSCQFAALAALPASNRTMPIPGSLIFLLPSTLVPERCLCLGVCVCVSVCFELTASSPGGRAHRTRTNVRRRIVSPLSEPYLLIVRAEWVENGKSFRPKAFSPLSLSLALSFSPGLAVCVALCVIVSYFIILPPPFGCCLRFAAALG